MPSHAHLMVEDGETVYAGAGPREDPARDHQDEGHHGRSAARGRALRGAQAARNGGHLRDRRRRQARRHRQGAAQDPHRPGGRRRAERVLAAARRARERAGRRSRPGGRAADGRAEQSARHPVGPRREGAARVSRQRDPGGLPAAGREHQRQAHRGHRPADDAVGEDRGCGRHRVPDRGAGGSLPVHGRERARDSGGRTPGDGPAAAARDHQGVALDRLVHLGGVVPGNDARAHRGVDFRQGGSPPRPEGERDDGPADPGRDRASSTTGTCGSRRTNRRHRRRRRRRSSSWNARWSTSWSRKRRSRGTWIWSSVLGSALGARRVFRGGGSERSYRLSLSAAPPP